MGLFGKRREAADAPLTPAEGMAGIAFAAVYADGVHTAEEHADVEAYLETLEPFAALGPAAVDEAIRKVDALARRDGVDAMLAACARAIPPEARATAYRMAADVLAADEEFGDMERRFLERVRATLGLDEATAASVLAARRG